MRRTFRLPRINEHEATSPHHQSVPMQGQPNSEFPTQRWLSGPQSCETLCFGCVLQFEKRYEGRASRERVVPRVALVLPKLENTSGNSQREQQDHVKGRASPH